MPQRKIEQKKKLSTEFNKPIKVRPQPPVPSGAARSLLPESQKHFEKEFGIWLKDLDKAGLTQIKKFMQLPAEYGLNPNDPGCWFMVAWELATQHLTGMQIHIQQKAGAKTKWDPIRLAALYYEVHFKVSESKRKRTVSEVCQELTKQARWKKYSKKTLENMYDKAAKSVGVLWMEASAKAHNAKVSKAVIAPLYAYIDENYPEN